MKKKFILIGHKKKHGKDTFAKMLKEHLGNAEILSFADPMRAIMAQLKGLSVDEYKAMYNEDEILRDELKVFGNGEMIEYFGEQAWRDVLLRRANELDCKYVIVPDFRFLREYIEGALTIKVHNPSVESEDKHQSETELDGFKFDIRVHNDSDLTTLKNKALKVVNLISFTADEEKETTSRAEEMDKVFNPKPILTEEDAIQYEKAKELFDHILANCTSVTVTTLSDNPEVVYLNEYLFATDIAQKLMDEYFNS